MRTVCGIMWHLMTSEDSGPLLGLSQALPHQSLLPCGVSSVSAEPYCNHVYRSAESICSARHLKTSRAETTGDPCGEVDTILACHDSQVGQTHIAFVIRGLRPQYNHLQNLFCNALQGRLKLPRLAGANGILGTNMYFFNCTPSLEA